ncbi:branched-chain amino acid transport system permease protein [Bradyrhizobium sp. USDA 4449]
MSRDKLALESVLRFAWPALVLSALLSVLAIAAMASGPGVDQVITEMMIRIIIVVGMYIFIGNSGMLSFGHIGFTAIGAYAAAWFTCCTLPMVKLLYLPGLPEWLRNNAYPFWVGVADAAIITGLVSAAVGCVIVRLAGVAASIATFAFLAIVFAVYSNWESVTGGTSSISNIPVEVGTVTAALGAVAAVWIAFLHQSSRYGLTLRASRDEPIAAQSAAVRIARMRLIAWVLSAVVVGVGGAFYSSFMGILTVDSFYIPMTFLTLAMLTVGGVQSLSGAVLGVLVLTSVTEFLRVLENGNGTFQLPKGVQEIGLGVVMIVILIYRPKGIMNGREIPFPRTVRFGRSPSVRKG